MADQIQIKLDDKELNAAIGTALQKVDDLRIPFTAISKSWFKSNRALFALKGPGKFADLAPDSGVSDFPYKRLKQEINGFVYPILRGQTQRLERSITDPESPDAVNFIIDKKTLVMGTSVPYAYELQAGSTGKKKMPARPFVMIGAEQTGPPEFNKRKEAFISILNDYVLQVSEPIGSK